MSMRVRIVVRLFMVVALLVLIIRSMSAQAQDCSPDCKKSHVSPKVDHGLLSNVAVDGIRVTVNPALANTQTLPGGQTLLAATQSMMDLWNDKEASGGGYLPLPFIDANEVTSVTVTVVGNNVCRGDYAP